MKTALNIVLISLVGLSVSFCSLFGGGAYQRDEAEKPQEMEDYQSSGVYKDIEGESRDVSSEDYADDDYGSAGDDDDDYVEEDDADLLSSNDDAEDEGATGQAASELPVETLDEPAPVKKSKPKKAAKFKNGMYRVSINCTMRSKPSTKARKAGTVKKGKKLWMEGHNKNWVKVFKKSGAVYINKLCL